MPAVVGPSNQLTAPVLTQAYGVRAFAAERTAVVDQFVAQLKDSVLSLVAPTITPEFPTGASAPAIAIPQTPDFTAPVWVSPNIPTAFTEVLATGDLDVEPFDDEPPVISYPAQPTELTATIPDAPGVNLTFEEPELSVSLPAAPDLLSISVRRFEGLNLPTFDADAPELVAVEPSVREYIPGAAYTSATLTALQTALERRITQGGTGIGAEVENAIWDRGREREARSQAEALRKLDQMEELGYAAPPGMYIDARTRIITEGEANDRGLSREIMVKQAEMELDQVKHALTTAVQLEGQMLDYTNQVEQRLFESTRYATEAGVSIYNAKVQAFSAMVDIYRAKVGAYEAQIRAETSKVDAYRAEVAAEEAKASVNRALVDQYRVQVDVALSNIRIFEARIAAIQAKADIEKTKVAIFGEQVRGYTAQVNAFTAGVEGYRATLQAEQTKQQVYASRVDAYAARVNAAARATEARIAAYEGRVRAKTAEYDGYRAAVAGETARVEGIVRSQGVIADAFKAEVQAVGMYNEVLTKQWQATLDQNQRTAEIGISTAKANAELYVTTRSLSFDAAKTGAQVAAQIGASAINALNVSASLSSSESYSGSDSYSESFSTATSDSTSTSTNYNYSASV